MLKAGGVKDDDKTPTRGLTGDGKDIIQTSVDGPNEDEDDPPKTGESLSKTASKGEKDSVKNFIEQFEEVTGDDNEENFWNAVMMAGLGIAAGDSDDCYEYCQGCFSRLTAIRQRPERRQENQVHEPHENDRTRPHAAAR